MSGRTDRGRSALRARRRGAVFAYCYARVGSRNLADWAVTATFDRARAALGNGGIPDPQLDWLLRTADKFCAPEPSHRRRSRRRRVGDRAPGLARPLVRRDRERAAGAAGAPRGGTEPAHPVAACARRVQPRPGALVGEGALRRRLRGQGDRSCDCRRRGDRGRRRRRSRPSSTTPFGRRVDKPAPSSGPSVPSGGALPSASRARWEGCRPGGCRRRRGRDRREAGQEWSRLGSRRDHLRRAGSAATGPREWRKEPAVRSSRLRRAGRLRRSPARERGRPAERQRRVRP